MNNTAPNWGPWAINWMGDVLRSSTSMTLPVYAGQIIEKSYFLETMDEKCWNAFFPKQECASYSEVLEEAQWCSV